MELRNSDGERIDPEGNLVTRKSPGNHIPIFDIGMKIEYREMLGFKFLYLEDSYVLAINVGGSVVIALEAVLLPGHPLYQPPRVGEQYCYAPLSIKFSEVQRAEWMQRRMKPIVDPDGSIDYGNIDTFFEENGEYRLEGEWGALRILSSAPTIG